LNANDAPAHANISMLFKELEFPSASSGGAAGLQGGRIQFPYTWDKGSSRESRGTSDVEWFLINIPAAIPKRRSRHRPCFAFRIREFREAVGKAIDTRASSAASR